MLLSIGETTPPCGVPCGVSNLRPLVFVACLEVLLNKLQHSAVGDLLSNQSQEFVVIDRPEIIFQIRVYDPLVPSLYFAPDLGQRISCLSTFPIPKTAG